MVSLSCAESGVNGVVDAVHTQQHRAVDSAIMGSSEGAAEREATATAQSMILSLLSAEDPRTALEEASYEIGRLIGHGLLDRTLWAALLRRAAIQAELLPEIGEDGVQAAIAAGFQEGERAAAEAIAGEAEAARGASRDVPTEADLADAFVERHGDQVRYVAQWARWLHYDGVVWRDERTHLVRDMAKTLCRQAAGRADTKDLRSLASARTVAAVQTLAQAHRRIAATVEQWDADPWVLNTPGGLIDLRSGDRLMRRADDYVTKITGTGPADRANCPMWLSFLEAIFRRTDGSDDGQPDDELIGYLQRVLGYALTGVTTEHAMFFGYGTGGNGKSVLLDTVAGIMGDYHTTAPIETFTTSSSDRHPTELARLVGARLVTSIETERGRAWAETRIKTLTGGDHIAARFMRQDFFEFRPQFKLLVAGNHQPTLRTVDEAIRRRFNLLPFTVTIPAERRDLDLASRLQAEWPAILQWMIEGCLAWQRQGLAPPASVTSATAQYLDAQDAMGAWIEECCEQGRAFQTRASELFASWRAYAERAGEPAGSTKTFGPLLEARGFPRSPSRRAGSVYMGIRLRADTE
jgi:putative DNA primase/helicase